VIFCEIFLFYGILKTIADWSAMPSTMTISLPDEMKSFVEEQAKAGSFSSASEFVRQLLRQEQKRAEQQKLEAMLLEGLDSGKPIRVTEAYLDDLQRRLQKRLHARGRTSAAKRA
jgi:antitoxin ParD1/3/4